MEKIFEICTISVIECLQVLRARVLCILAISGVSMHVSRFHRYMTGYLHIGRGFVNVVIA